MLLEILVSIVLVVLLVAVGVAIYVAMDELIHRVEAIGFVILVISSMLAFVIVATLLMIWGLI